MTVNEIKLIKYALKYNIMILCLIYWQNINIKIIKMITCKLFIIF